MNQENSKIRFEELLVPYIQNRLDASERKFIEELANNDNELNKKLQFEKQLANSIQQSDIELKEVTPSFQKLKQQIESSSNKVDWWNVFSWNFSGITEGINPGLVVATLAVVCVGVYMLLPQNTVNPLEDGYETLSNDDSGIVYEHDRQYFRIILAAGLAEAEIQTLSDEHLFTIESGPDSLNSYVISFAKDDTQSKNALQELHNDSRFLMAEPLSNINTEN